MYDPLRPGPGRDTMVSCPVAVNIPGTAFTKPAPCTNLELIAYF